MSDNRRTSSHLRSPELEASLKELERLIGGADTVIQPREDLPIVFIMGCPRSGTTLLSQALAAATDWCYPTNLISRFYYAPYIGALIQQILVEQDNRGELLGKRLTRDQFKSDLGKTSGPLSPHEFWYFWRRHFRFLAESGHLDRTKLTDAQKESFVHGIRCLQEVFGKPLFMKGMLLNLDVDLLSELIPNSFFIHLERDIFSNADSLLRARQNFYGTDDEWYSLKPKEYHFLSKLSPREQVVGQVHYTNAALKRQFSLIDARRSIHLSYEAFCENPGQKLEKVWSHFGIEVDPTTDIFPSNGFVYRNADPTAWNDTLASIKQP